LVRYYKDKLVKVDGARSLEEITEEILGAIQV